MKERVIDEAEKMFRKHGVRTITMDDIARRLGISKKTIYQHFTDKDDLVYQVAVHNMTREADDYACIMQTSTNPIQEMLKASEMMKVHLADVNPNLVQDIQKYHPKAWDVVHQFEQQHVVKSIADNIRTGIDQGLYRTNLDPETMARLRLQTVHAAFNDAVFPRTRLSMEAIQQQLMEHFIRGLLTEKGFSVYHEYINHKEYETK